MSLLLDAVETAYMTHKQFTDWELSPPPSTFSAFMKLLPNLFTRIDNSLFQGALFRTMKAEKINFRIRVAKTGPAGLTTFDAKEGMQLFLNQNAWVRAFPAMVGGTLCHSADLCLSKIFAHEMLHVLLFTIYHALHMTHKDIMQLPSAFDVHHNVLFCTWLKAFFGQDTIDNSLLLHLSHPGEKLTFDRSVNDIEKQCLRQGSSHLQVLYKGVWQEADLVREDSHHQSLVTVPKTRRKLLVPNGLLRC